MSYVGHSPEHRATVVADSIEIGVSAAAAKHNLSRETVRRWRRERGVPNERRRKMVAP